MNDNTRMGLVIFLCSNSNHLISLISPNCLKFQTLSCGTIVTMNYDHELQQSTDNRYSTTAGILISNFYPERKENIYGHLNGRLLTLSIYFLSTEVKK